MSDPTHSSPAAVASGPAYAASDPGYAAPPPGFEHSPPTAGYDLASPATALPGGPAITGAARARLHQPGLVALRPLRLSELLDCAFKVIRLHPSATVVPAVIVAIVGITLPFLVGQAFEFALSADSSGNSELARGLSVAGLYGSLAATGLVQWIGSTLVSAMIAHVCLAAITGSPITLREAWRRTRGSRWRTLGLALLLVLAFLIVWGVCIGVLAALVSSAAPVGVVVAGFVVLIPVALVATIVIWTKFAYYSAPALVLEHLPIRAAVRRAAVLTRGAFWRTLGIGALGALIAQIAGLMLQGPFLVGSELVKLFDPLGQGDFAAEVLTSLGTVVASALVTPFLAGLMAFQYIDQRMRSEAFDLELMTGGTP